MTEVLEDQIDEMKTSARAAFIKSLDKRIDHIQQCWASVQQAEDKIPDLINLVYAMHYLSGGAGLHALNAISRLAYSVISQVTPSIEMRVPFTKESGALVEKTLDTIYQQVSHYQNDMGIQPFRPVSSEDEYLSTFEDTEVTDDIFVLEANNEEEHVLKVFLENSGYSIRTFKSLHKLTAALSRTYPQAVIIGDQDGRLQNEANASPDMLEHIMGNYPVYVLSEQGDMHARLQAARYGATMFFEKPVDGYRLIDTLQKNRYAGEIYPSRVILVDDDPETAQFIALHLRLEGLIVHVLNDPIELLDAMVHFKPDLVLTDMYMPGCNGLELAAVIRQHEKYNDLPIAFLTSDTDQTTRLASLQLGSEDFFSKSTDIQLIAKAIKTRMQRLNAFSHDPYTRIYALNADS